MERSLNKCGNLHCCGNSVSIQSSVNRGFWEVGKLNINPGATRGWEARHPQFMKTRDARITFDCLCPGFIQVNELINGEITHSQMKQGHPDVVTEMERKYIFFADEAARARKLLSKGHSCFFNVYFREP